MPVRLIKPYNGQAVNTLYFGTDEAQLRDTGNADDMIELASDYSRSSRIVTAATATMSRTAETYYMNSASPQTLTVPMMGYAPVGTVRTIIQKGAGAFTLAPATGVTFSTALTGYLSKGVNNIAQIVKDGVNSWTAFGGIN